VLPSYGRFENLAFPSLTWSPRYGERRRARTPQSLGEPVRRRRRWPLRSLVHRLAELTGYSDDAIRAKWRRRRGRVGSPSFRSLSDKEARIRPNRPQARVKSGMPRGARRGSPM
jgi:hypothetical protein